MKSEKKSQNIQFCESICWLFMFGILRHLNKNSCKYGSDVNNVPGHTILADVKTINRQQEHVTKTERYVDGSHRAQVRMMIKGECLPVRGNTDM